MSTKQNTDKQVFTPRTGDQIRKAFIDFFADRGHQVIPSASLVPDDPTVLLTIAGMLPFKPVFLGKESPPAPRATTSQKCIRTNDIENVGKTARHHTFFEMLGNFSFGDYFKREAIEWAWELSVNVYKLDPKNLVVSVFCDDKESEKIWRDFIGVNPKRIIKLNEKDNFWSSGVTGPCGPCSELYYDFTPELGDENIDLEDDKRFIEFYNLVFMQYNCNNEGVLVPLDNCNIDTGLGLERMAQILQNKPNNYETDLIYPLIEKASSLAGVDYKNLDSESIVSIKVIADHSRAVIHLISDGVTVSNLGRGYILRRLLRRMIRHGRLIGIHNPFLKSMGCVAIDLMKHIYPQLENKKSLIIKELELEEVRFLQTLERGEKLLDEIIGNKKSEISGKDAFELYDTYGFPLELTKEIADERGIKVDMEGFNDEMKRQKSRAKEASIPIDMTEMKEIEKVTSEFSETIFDGYNCLIGKSRIIAIISDGTTVDNASEGENIQIVLDRTTFFGESGGQIGDKGIIFGDNSMAIVNSVKREKNVFVHSAKVQEGKLFIDKIVNTKVDQHLRECAQANHTATHLLQSALKSLIDSDISQKGSLVAFDRLRFDFNYSEALTNNQLSDIEQLINQWIVEDHSLIVKIMPIEKALKIGALAMFGEKYGDVVRVVDIPGVSMELCGGTHIKKTSDLSIFKIISESGVASGIRRIEAVSGLAAIEYLNQRDRIVSSLSNYLKAPQSEIYDRVISLQNEVKSSEKELISLKRQLAITKVLSLASQARLVGDRTFVVQRLDCVDSSALQKAAQELINQLGTRSAVVLGGLPNPNDLNKVIFVAAFGQEIISHGLHAGKFISQVAGYCGGGGGGKPNIAQAGGRNGDLLNNALQEAEREIEKDFSR